MNFHFLVHKRYNLVENGPVVSEKNKFLFLYVNYHGQRSRYDLDLEYMYSHIFINSISCLYPQVFRSQPAIVSEKCTVFTCSYRKA